MNKKTTLVIGGILLFLFVGFRPPTGMSKFPTASVEFSEQAQPMMSSAILK